MKTKLQILQTFTLWKLRYLTLVLFSIVTLQASANPNQNLKSVYVTTNFKNTQLADVFANLEKQTKFTFVFDSKLLENTKAVNLNVRNESLDLVLNKIAAQTRLSFTQINNTITVVRNEIQQQIKGRVFDKDGLPLPGATVKIQGSSTGVTTDFDGVFTINAGSAVVLEVSYLGFTTKTVNASPGEDLSITLEENVNALNEVVVTALGIKREEKKLGYAQQTVSSEELLNARPNNWSEALRGKVPGLTINGLGGPIGSQQIILRGNSSLDPGNNGALIVIDGIPVQNEFPGSGASNAYMGGASSTDTPVDFGNAIANLNPEDIESISVLKGPAASALYGYQAANGAILITTKKGQKQTGLGVTITSNAKMDVITRWPDWQYEYGQGSGRGSYLKPATDSEGNPVAYEDRLYYTYGASEDGRSTAGSSSAFGPRFNGQFYFQYDPELEGQSEERQLWRPYKDNRKGFWRKGLTLTNNISFQGGSEKGSMRASVTHTKNEWIMPNTGFEQMSLSVNAKHQISKRINLSSIVNYSKRMSDNLPGQGYNNHSIAYFMIFQNPNVDLDWYRPIWKEGQEQIDMIRPYSSFIDNPYAMAYEIENSLNQHAITGNFQIDIELHTNLSLMLRGALNMYNKNMDQRRPYDINRYARGYYRKTNVFKNEINTDFLLTYTNKFGDLDLTANVGGNSLDYEYLRQDSWTEGLEIPGVYNLVNGSQLFTSKFEGYNKVNSLYSLVSLGLKDFLFVDFTGRNDWNSMLPKQNMSYFFPSASASFVVSELAELPKSIDFLKLRGSVAQVGGAGQYGNRYSTSKYFSRSDFPGSAVAPHSLYNTDFKPEITTSTELGFDLRMFKSRLKLDAAVYQTTSKNQIFSSPLPNSSGYSSALINAGSVRNQGIELLLNAKVINTPSFSWNTTLNWSKNKGKVLSLHENAEEGRFEMLSSSGARLVAVEGGSPAALFGRGYERNPQGEIIFDADGFPLMTDDIIFIGDTQPKWVAGFINSFQYKNLRLNVVIDGKYGGVIYSHTHHKLTQQGKLKHTLIGREEGVRVGEGVVLNEDGTYSPNTTAIPIADYYNEMYPLANTEANSFDASFVKLREVTLEYNFSKKLLAGSFLSEAAVSLYGRNLAVISDFPIYDPEVAGLAGGTNFHPGAEVGQMPSPSEFGINVKVGF